MKSRPVEFSFWPMERTTRRYGLGTRVFATDPWTVVRRSTEKFCLASAKPAAFALLEQAEDFYIAADSEVKAAKPLLLYYCFMNLAKAFVLTCGQRSDVNNAQHGLQEALDPPPNDKELVNAFLRAFPSPATNGKLNNFDELLRAVESPGLAAATRYDLTALMPQVVPGHRLWVEATPKEKERFVSVERVELRRSPPKTPKKIWICVYVFADDMTRINMTHQSLLSRSRLSQGFREVACNEERDGRALVCFEQTQPVVYSDRPADKVQQLVDTVKHLLWRTILSTPPYRKYYLYAGPVSEHPQVVPQIASLYAITYYLGSIVRYRPHHFDRILDDRYGPFIEAFLNDQPRQFIYLLASRFAKREVTKAALV